MKSAALTILILLIALMSSMAQAEPISFAGVVLGPTGHPLSGATVTVRGTQNSTISDLSGSFQLSGEFNLPVTIEVVLPGFVSAEKTISTPSDPLEFILQLAQLKEEVRVQAELPRSESPDHLELNQLKILATPGSYADPMRAVQMLPGVAQMDNGAGLYVRGGDVGETSTYINRSLMAHPYRYETPTGGLFGAVDTFFIEGVSLSTGGFPARYGNALSGVLELNTVSRPDITAYFANIGLASGSINLSAPLGKHAGVRLAGNRSFTRVLFAVNPPQQHFYNYPSGYDVSSELYYESPRAGRFTSYLYRGSDSAGLQVESLNFTGALASSATNALYSLSWERPLAWGWNATASLSYSSLDQATAAGVLNLDKRDQGSRARLDLTRPLLHGLLRAGMDAERLHEQTIGVTPKVGTDLGGVQGTLTWNQSYPELRVGSYAEYEFPIISRLTLNLGLRDDAYRTAATLGYDPRLALQYALTPRQNLRLAWGVYHQAPAAGYFDRQWGNPAMGLMRAQHSVVSYTYGQESSNLYLKLEGYNKRYGKLPLETAGVNFAPVGSGYARGFDVLVKAKRGSRWEGWASYSFVSSRRRWTSIDNRSLYPVPTEPVPPDFDIPHTLQLVVRGDLPASWSVGASFRAASGKPYTPVLGATPISGGYVPAWGPINSQRLPMYQRLDLNLSRPFSNERAGIFRPYLGISNLLDRKNIFQYVYSADYSQRRPAATSSQRSFYFGVTFSR